MSSGRREIIHELFQKKPFVSLEELQEMFPNVSGMTLRRDIEFFEEKGEVIKVRGGARSMKFILTSDEDTICLRMHANSDAKIDVAREAVRFVETGRSIFLDSGTTILRLADLIPDERLTVTTTGINVAMELMKKNMPMVNMVGGMINRDNVTVSGNQSLQFIDSINIDVAFMVPSGASTKDGFTCGNYIESDIKRKVIEKARKVVLLMDASKINKSLPYTFAAIDQVDCIICNEELPSDMVEKAREAGVEIIVAK